MLGHPAYLGSLSFYGQTVKPFFDHGHLWSRRKTIPATPAKMNNRSF
jgi:hypothetical protein